MNRRYDLDWLRVMAFGILMLFHTGMAFSSYDWHVKNFETSALIDHLIRFLHTWRMPLLFFISGAAVWFAMEKYSTWRYVRERQTRLLIPLLFGLLIVIPPQVYCERVYQRQGYASFFDFYPTVFTSGPYPQGNLSWHHLWYIPYIWAFSMITLPAFAWLRTGSGRRFLGRLQKVMSSPIAPFALFIPSAIAEILLRPFYPGDSCDLISDWANFTHKLTFFVVGFMLASGTNVSDTLARHRWKFLTAALVSLLVLQAIWLSYFRMGSHIGYRCLSNFHTWMWILTALGFGRHYLNFNHRFLRYATDAVYPFYILHQTVIVILALALVYVDLGLWTKYCVVLAGMSLFTWLLYEGVISRVNVLRVCFGLKPKRPRVNAAVTAQGQSSHSATRGCSAPVFPSGPAATLTCLALGAVACFWAAAAPARDGKLLPVIVPSSALEDNLLGISDRQPAAVYLPPSYGIEQKRFPVIYFLPNFNTPIWRYTGGNYQGFRLRETADRLIKSGSMPEVIIVVPNASHVLGSGWYRNSPIAGRWEDYVVHNVVGYIDAHFRTIPDARSRGVAGHGVGGTGALELALKHPDVFGCVYAMSPVVLNEGGVRDFRQGGDNQAARWQTLVDRWTQRDQQGARRGFALYLQSRLNSFSRDAQFEAVRLSCLAAASPMLTAPYPHIAFPTPGTHTDKERERVWAEIMGNWEAKLQAYMTGSTRVHSIAIEYGRQDEYQFIRNGAEHVSRLMRSMEVPNTLTVSEGGHDSTLGRRLEKEMLPAMAKVLQDIR